jgi:DNA polymerase-2
MDKDTHAHTAFLLTHSYRDVRGHFEIVLDASIGRGRYCRIVVDNFHPMFFVHRNTPVELTGNALERKALELTALDGAAVDCLYFATYAGMQEAAQRLADAGVKTYEADVHPVERYLMERFVMGGFSLEGTLHRSGGVEEYRNPRIRGCDVHPEFCVLSLDIETNARSGELYSIAFHGGGDDRVFVIGDAADTQTIIYCDDERQLLERAIAYITWADPDILIGWNVIDFDLAILAQRSSALGVPFSIGRIGDARIFTSAGSGRQIIRIPGRVVLDGPTMLRSQFHTFESFALDNVASELLGKHKIITATSADKIAEINRLFAHDKEQLARYNLEDAILTKEVFDKTNIIANAVERSKRSGHLLDRTGGSVAAFDHLYLPRLHRAGYVAGNVADVQPPVEPLSGGHVMESRPGLYENVLLLDFKSLYPTIIKTFAIDPLGYARASETTSVKGPTGTAFAATEGILPEIIADLLDARAHAKKTKNQPLSQAIKILMNSFYGVLGSTGCRFFSHQLAETITGTGRHILRQTSEHIEKSTGYSVIYGDTDSLFIDLGPGAQERAARIGRQMVEETNAWLTGELKDRYNVTSSLELEFETHFRHFFMPTIRGSTQGSKKRYCGAVERDGTLQLLFKGLESARGDWTPLAKEFQKELYLRVFEKRFDPDLIISLVTRLRRGELDDKLIYRKQLRKPLAEYTTNVPPHAQAARLLDKPGRFIRYCITMEGPQPAEKLLAPIDYDHYIDTQLKPVADAILEWVGMDFDTILSGQQDLFAHL